MPLIESSAKDTQRDTGPEPVSTTMATRFSAWASGPAGALKAELTMPATASEPTRAPRTAARRVRIVITVRR